MNGMIPKIIAPNILNPFLRAIVATRIKNGIVKIISGINAMNAGGCGIGSFIE